MASAMPRTGAVQENYRRQPASGMRILYNAHGHPALLTTIAVQLQALQLQLAIIERLPTLIPYLPPGLCVTGHALLLQKIQEIQRPPNSPQEGPKGGRLRFQCWRARWQPPAAVTARWWRP